ncbi:hypothetical protein U9R90_14435 [Streptomyces sp. E11-3]|uniref:hypothetical protein n=1 Tax=Streptomyces sp. E11-3 TaxID=3110112 RepID=UPI003981894F
MRRAGVVAAGAAAVALAGTVPAGAVAPEADVSYHGFAALGEGRLGVWLVPANHGPADVSDATVRLRYSVALAPRQELPDGCLRSARRVVLCGTGELKAGERGEKVAVVVRLAGAPSQATVRIDTVWSGAAADRNPDNDRHQVLALDTGDSYVF